MSKEVDEELRKMKEIFDLFDKDKDGFITTNELDDCLRANHLNPTQSELSKYKSDFDKFNDGKISFAKFREIFQELKQNALTEESLISCFKIFDKKNTGFINVDEFKNAMTTVGDRMDAASFEEILRWADVKGEKIEYKEFVKKLLQN